MSAPGVLAVMDVEIQYAENSLWRRETVGAHLRLCEAKEARAVVAELIDQAKAPAVAYGCKGSLGIHFVSDDREDCVAESRRDGSLVVELIERPAALARVSGGAK